MKNKSLAQGIDGSGKKIQSRIWFFSLVEEENPIQKQIENLASCGAVNVFTIRHDKDKIKQDDGTTVPKRPHWHFAIRFENPATIQTIANIFMFGVDEYKYIQRAKSWRGSLRYMLHLDNRDKHLYDISELVVVKGTKDDYFNVAIGKAQVVTTDADLFPDFGDFDKVPYQTQYLDVFSNVDDNKRRNLLLKELKTSWENYLLKRRYEMKNKNVTVVFVQGKAGSGKSTFAQMLANQSNKSYCISSSSNDVMQDYTCEDYLILDDLRDDTFKFDDLLKLLDNFVISSIKSRYSNKMFLGDTIVITSAKPLCDWYKDNDEDKQQLYRRINMFAECERIKGADGVDSLIAKMYMYPPNTPAIKNNGLPNGKPVPVPIIDLTPSMVKSSVQCLQALGFNEDTIKGVVAQIAEPLQKSIFDEMTPEIQAEFDQATAELARDLQPKKKK